MKKVMKKMKKKLKEKGFTLVELLVGIAILGLLATIGTITYNQVYQGTLEKQLNNKISYVEISATKWAKEKNLDTSTVINVSTLINDGYLQADDYVDDNPVYDNPIDNSSLLCYMIAIDKDGNTYNAKMDMNAGENCDIEFQRQMNQNIKIDAYSYENGHVITKLNKKENIVDWTNKDVLLVVSSEVYHFNKISFSARGGSTVTKGVNNNLLTNVSSNQAINPDSYANVIVVTANVYFHEEYTVGLYTNDGVKNGTIDIRIDKQPPKIDNITTDNEWAKEKTVDIKASDGSGSGLYGIYVSDSNTCSINYYNYTKTEQKISKTFNSDKTYYACAIDKAGNITNPYQFIISRIDHEGALDNDIILTQSTQNWTRSLTVTAKATDYKSGLIEYAFTESNSTPTTWQKINNSPTNRQVTYDFTIENNKTYYFWVKDAVGNVNNKSITISNIDRKIDKISLSKNTSQWTTSLTLTGIAEDTQSKIVAYQFNQSSEKPESGWISINNLQQITQEKNINQNGKYYFWIKDAANNIDKAYLEISNIGTIKTIECTVENEQSSTINGECYLENAKSILSVTSNQGRVSSDYYLSTDSYLKFTVSGGTKETGICTQSYFEEPTCDGGTFNNGQCYGDNGANYWASGNEFPVKCIGGKYFETGTWSGDLCSAGYKRKGNTYRCDPNYDGEPCTEDTTNTCEMYCEYTAQPRCDEGRMVHGLCRITEDKNCSHWKYTITVKYIV